MSEEEIGLTEEQYETLLGELEEVGIDDEEETTD